MILVVDKPKKPRATKAAQHRVPTRTIVNFGVDALLLVVFTALCGVSLVVRFVFPAPTVADGYSVWGRGYDAWTGLQVGLLGGMALVVLVHVMLHWTWVCNVALLPWPQFSGSKAKVNEGSMTLYGVALLVVILVAIGVFVAFAGLAIRAP